MVTRKTPPRKGRARRAELRCVYCGSRYVNYAKYCVMCHRVQPRTKSSWKLSPADRARLLRDLRRGVASGDLNMTALARTYGIATNTVAYWKAKLGKNGKRTGGIDG